MQPDPQRACFSTNEPRSLSHLLVYREKHLLGRRQDRFAQRCEAERRPRSPPEQVSAIELLETGDRLTDRRLCPAKLTRCSCEALVLDDRQEDCELVEFRADADAQCFRPDAASVSHAARTSLQDLAWRVQPLRCPRSPLSMRWPAT